MRLIKTDQGKREKREKSRARVVANLRGQMA